MKVLTYAVGFIVLVVAIGLLLAWPTAYLINSIFAPSFLTSIFGVAHVGVVRTWMLRIVLGVLFYRPSSSGK